MSGSGLGHTCCPLHLCWHDYSFDACTSSSPLRNLDLAQTCLVYQHAHHRSCQHTGPCCRIAHQRRLEHHLHWCQLAHQGACDEARTAGGGRQGQPDRMRGLQSQRARQVSSKAMPWQVNCSCAWSSGVRRQRLQASTQIPPFNQAKAARQSAHLRFAALTAAKTWRGLGSASPSSATGKRWGQLVEQGGWPPAAADSGNSAAEPS